MVSLYLFSLGMFSAHVVHRIHLNQIFQRDLKELNSLNHQKQDLLGQLHQDLQKTDPSVAAHVLALQQKAIDYEYANLLIVENEQNQLQEFYVNFLSTMIKVYPEQGLTAQTLLFLEQRLKVQRATTISALSDML
jgi:hypothetical protein